jgi:hypothetical protein
MPPDGAGKTNRGGLIALGVLAALVVIGGAVYLVSDDDSDDETELTGSDTDSTSTTSSPESAPTTDPSSPSTTSPATTVPITEPPVTTPPVDPGDPGSPGDPGNSPAGGPEETVEQFFTAVAIDQDCETVLDLVTSDSIDWFGDTPEDQLATCQDFMTDVPDTTLESMTLVSETATEAVVETSVIEEGEPSTDPITLRWEDERWKVDISA